MQELTEGQKSTIQRLMHMEMTLDYYQKRLSKINDVVNVEIPLLREAGVDIEPSLEVIKALSDVGGWRKDG